MASMTAGGIFAVQARQPIQFGFDGGQLIAQRKRKEGLCGAALLVVRTDLAPPAQQTIFVARLCAEIVQTLAKVGDAHREVGSGKQSEPENNCGETVWILTHFELGEHGVAVTQ